MVAAPLFGRALLPGRRHRTVKTSSCDEKIGASVNKALLCQPESSLLVQ